MFWPFKTLLICPHPVTVKSELRFILNVTKPLLLIGKQIGLILWVNANLWLRVIIAKSVLKKRESAPAPRSEKIN